MEYKRWLELELRDADIPLTKQEIAEGWHYCPDWDFMLVGPGMDELQGCLCETPA